MRDVRRSELLSLTLARAAFGTALLFSFAAQSCGGDSSEGGPTENCAVGSERCVCTQGGSCDKGLACRSGRCVSLGGNGGGGAGGTGVTGATGGAMPAGGGPSDGGPPPDAATNVDGSVPDGGASVDAAAPLPPCTTSADCASDSVCAIKVDGSGYCITGSGKPCEAGDACVHGMGFDPQNGKIEGPMCQTASDCEQRIDGIVDTVCLKDENGRGGCATLCEYRDDPANLKCATHPHIGIRDDCTRDQIRVLSYEVAAVGCVGFRVKQWSCVSNPRALTADEDWMMTCVLQSMAHGGAICYPVNCFAGSGSPPEAKVPFQSYLDLADEYLDVVTEQLPGGGAGGSGGSSQCSSDCECGHCGYCESGTCRYGGEGPYGCYRGCN